MEKSVDCSQWCHGGVGAFVRKLLLEPFCANPLLRRSPLKMNIKHIIFFENIKIETKQKKT